VATPSARGGYATPSPRSSPAHNASKAKFRNLSKHAPAGASSTRGEPHAAASVGSAFESTFDGKAAKTVESTSNRTFDGKAAKTVESTFNRTFDGKAEKAVESTFNRTFDGKAEASTTTANKTSIGLTANLARASMSNLNAGNKSQRGQGSQRTGDSSARSSSTADAAMSPVGGGGGGGGGGAVRPSAPSAASASAAAPPSNAPKSAAAPLGSPAAERTMAQKVARVKEELSLDPSLPVAKAVAEANAAMGIEGQGTLAQQVDFLLTELGVL
jgi:hypothetical protein